MQSWRSGDDSQSSHRSFLENDCSALDFDRDAYGHVLSNPAGANLAVFCFVPPPGPGPIVGGAQGDPVPGVSTSATGGGAAAAAGRASARFDDAVLHDRREQARKEGDPTDPATTAQAEIELFEAGRAAGFVSLDRRFERQRSSEFESGRRSYSVAATLGADYRVGTGVVVGLALTHTELSGDFSGGGDFEHDGHGVCVYGSWLLGERAFVDISGGVDAQNRRTRRLVGLTTITVTPDRTLITIEPPVEAVDANMGSREKHVEIAGGLDFVVGTVTVGPRAAFVQRRAGIGSFVESGRTPDGPAGDGRETLLRLDELE